jgi:hypothetical protein
MYAVFERLNTNVTLVTPTADLFSAHHESNLALDVTYLVLIPQKSVTSCIFALIVVSSPLPGWP